MANVGTAQASAGGTMSEEIALGPVLRGASFVERAGALFHYSPASASGEVGATAASGTELVLDALPDRGELVARYREHRSLTGEDPASIRLPSGARWVRDSDAPAPAAVSPSSGVSLTPGVLANVVRDRVVLVTGAAQGFGWELARGLAALGAVIAIADVNIEGAAERAAELGQPHAAFALNVGNEESVAVAVDEVVAQYGGIDVLVSNAGVLRAGSVQELSVADFRFVTDVNYVGFFLMTKHVSRVMEAQYHAAKSGESAPHRPRYLTDIIEINSKSGLEGSNKNGAYAGSKFGGIGLVQSFALELIEHGTKVNAICPGNFLDGPLWSDPDRGLFVQYLRAGKVPGAETIADVRRFYESKVPMNRGCTGTDVLRALVYVVGQEYETGQAVPVTGGQVMLS